MSSWLQALLNVLPSIIQWVINEIEANNASQPKSPKEQAVVDHLKDMKLRADLLKHEISK